MQHQFASADSHLSPPASGQHWDRKVTRAARFDRYRIASLRTDQRKAESLREKERNRSKRKKLPDQIPGRFNPKGCQVARWC